jgi:hypothetical protein
MLMRLMLGGDMMSYWLDKDYSDEEKSILDDVEKEIENLSEKN